MQSIGVARLGCLRPVVLKFFMQSASLSKKYAARHSLSLPALIRQRRGKLGPDTRPNKALDPDRLTFLLQGYPLVETLVKVARHGICPTWTNGSPPRRRPPENHKSACLFLPALLKSIRQGQAGGTYLVVNLSLLHQWPETQYSPFGAVEKKGVDPSIEVRPIHDLSYPDSASSNAFFDITSAPDVEYISVVALARRIEWLANTHSGFVIKMLKDDVKSAFRHLMLHAGQVHWMGATVPAANALIVDMAAPFGWSGSPSFYSAFGRAISWFVGTNSPESVSESSGYEMFFEYEWVDDHILIEPDREDRLELAEATLRLSMMAVLGPGSINEEKFSQWSTQLQALGLLWDTVERAVTMPTDRIQKCIDRISALLDASAASKQQLQKLLGSLRHVTTCLRSAKPFFQHLQTICKRLRPFQSVRLSEDARCDLRWFRYILSDRHLDKLPLLFFRALPAANINIYMDASNDGLAVLHPAQNEYIQVRFDAEEIRLIAAAEQSDFTINVRDHFCMALAAWCWGPRWQHDFDFPHIVCWSDNVSAVSWINRLHSDNKFGQEINRAIGLAEAVFRIRLSARHLPGSANRMADVGSRAWSPPHSHIWSHLSHSWRQVQVPEHWRRIYNNFSVNCSHNRWPSRRSSATGRRGTRGSSGALTWSTAPGSQATLLQHPANSFSSLYSATDTEVAQHRLTTNHPVQNQRNCVISSTGVGLQHQPPPAPRHDSPRHSTTPTLPSTQTPRLHGYSPGPPQPA